MPDASFFADKALRCRELAGRTSNSYVAEQLRVWAGEFEFMAQVAGLALVDFAPPQEFPQAPNTKLSAD